MEKFFYYISKTFSKPNINHLYFGDYFYIIYNRKFPKEVLFWKTPTQ